MHEFNLFCGRSFFFHLNPIIFGVFAFSTIPSVPVLSIPAFPPYSLSFTSWSSKRILGLSLALRLSGLHRSFLTLIFHSLCARHLNSMWLCYPYYIFSLTFVIIRKSSALLKPPYDFPFENVIFAHSSLSSQRFGCTRHHGTAQLLYYISTSVLLLIALFIINFYTYKKLHVPSEFTDLTRYSNPSLQLNSFQQ